MKKQSCKSHTLRRWELALLLGVALAALLGAWLDKSQSDLADQVIRLHVLANSDSEADQALKLQVRDRVLEVAESYFQPGATREETEAILRTHLADLAAAGAETVGAAGYDYPVTASLEENYWFPTKEYEDFALPAGEYTALRVVIGEGDGRNWWCVVFPPLCATAAEYEAIDALGGNGELLTASGDGVEIRFRLVELWGELLAWLRGL